MNEVQLPSGRHFDLAFFEKLLAKRIPFEYRLPGEPLVTLFIAPDRPAVGLHLPVDVDNLPPSLDLDNIEVRIVRLAGDRRLEISVLDEGLFLAAYPVLLSISDKVQVDGIKSQAALASTIRTLKQLLHRTGSLSSEVELGLYGELLFLEGLVTSVGANRAVQSWKGPKGEEHDFGVQGVDLEIKTTAAEARLHWIDSLSQLMPTRGRRLWLVSYAVTIAGSDGGRSLPDLIDRLRDCFELDGLRENFDELLDRSGWQDSYRAATRTLWCLRREPTAFEVDSAFPKLTTDILTVANVEVLRIPDVRYRVDLTDWPAPHSLPDLVAGALQDGGAK